MRNLNTHAVHIHGGISVVSLGATTAQNQKWLSAETLADMGKPILRNKTVCVHNQEEGRLNPASRQYAHLGYQNVRLYNGGWMRSANNMILSIVAGDNPYIEECML